MSSNFEEWMKMATDNKINAANSWNFALIDYFHDMSLLRNNTDNSINFQRASCTLDGCVKIWTSRVDSVGTETGKLLSNLANEGRGDGAEDEEGGNSDNPDGQDPTQGQRKRKAHRAESTLAKSVVQLRSKKLDLEFSVDPLFRKTCADFDEGGAHGLLMNHLSLGVGSDGSLRVVFDASDSMGKGGDEEEPLEEPQDEVDLSELKKQFLPSLDVLDDKAISHSLEGFSFSKDAFSFDETTFFREDSAMIDDDDDDNDNDPGVLHGEDHGALQQPPMDVDSEAAAPAEDFFVGEQAVGGDFNAGNFDNGDNYGGNHVPDGPEAMPGQPGQPGAFVPFDPRRVPDERDLVMAMTDGGLMMDYFDQTFLKNWAGPEHWKLRKVVRKSEPSEVAGPKAKREKKEAFKIDFLTSSEKDVKTLAKELFAPVAKGAGISLPAPASGKASGRRSKSKKGKEKEKRNDQTLPDDMHFSSRQLVTLFLKPKFSLKMRGRRVRGHDRGDGEVDENFWAQAAANQAAGRVDDDDETVNGGTIPFNTQFFHDDYDDAPGFEDIYDGADQDTVDHLEPGEQDLLAATQGQTRRVRPEFVNYAKRAKRVDVRKLKENIWKGLDIVVPEGKGADEDEDAMDIDGDGRAATDPAEPRVFTSVISGLQKAYPKEKMEEISTSFCFICLLHLANERGLKLETGAGGADDRDDDRPVGNIWDLKVYRDPSAYLATV
ncbi:Condensin complex subunit 2 [Sparassis crispa]|uniref:Condensin complex subunit 2 n=1 Tax=Sparassis crispa TaxID=139825 RepID=A0A401GW64_9APHY|nr:Condensin complex subunit 2 [Sparassis crispa]GBE86468.1 Condensin complex subunit 2 [Sparassis crispa]